MRCVAEVNVRLAVIAAGSAGVLDLSLDLGQEKQEAAGFSTVQGSSLPLLCAYLSETPRANVH